MSKIRFNTDITLGNVLSILSAIFAAVSAFYALDKRLSLVEYKQEELRHGIQLLTDGHRAVTTGQANIEKMLLAITPPHR